MTKGFARAESEADDLALDMPSVKEALPALKQRALGAGWLQAASE